MKPITAPGRCVCIDIMVSKEVPRLIERHICSKIIISELIHSHRFNSKQRIDYLKVNKKQFHIIWVCYIKPYFDITERIMTRSCNKIASGFTILCVEFIQNLNKKLKKNPHRIKIEQMSLI